MKRGMPKCVEDIKKSAKAKSVSAVQLAAGVCEQGDWAYAMCQNDNLLGVAWWDSGTCMFMSNCHNQVEKAVKRRKRRHVGQKDVRAPECAVDYNENMGAINDINRVRALCSTCLRLYKWYLAILFLLLNSCLNNTFSLFFKHHQDTPLGK